MSKHASRAVVASILLLIFYASFSAAQEVADEAPTPPSTAAMETITSEMVQQRRAQAEKVSDLDEKVQASIAELYNTAADELERSAELELRAQTFASSLESVNERLAAIEKQQQQIATREPLPPEANTPEKLDQIVLGRKKVFETLKDVLQKVESEIAGRASRRQTIRTRIAAIEGQLSDLETNLKAAAPTAEAAVLTQAKRTELLSRRQFLNNELPALKAEIAVYDAEDSVELLRKQLDLTTQQVALADAELKLAEDAARVLRDQQAQQAVQAAKDAIMKAHPSLRDLATENKSLADTNKKLATQLEEKQAKRDEAKAELEELQRTFSTTQQKVDSVVGLPESVGALLRKQRSNLPNARKLRQELNGLQTTINNTQLELFDLEEKRAALSNVDQRALQFVSENIRPVDDKIHQQLVNQAAYFFQAQKDILTPLIRVKNDHFTALTELSVSKKQLLDASGQFSDYIDQRVLWIRSAPNIAEGFALKNENFRALSGPSWMGAVATLVQDAKRKPFLYALMGLFVVVLAIAEVPLQQRLRKLGADASRGSFLRFFPTVRAVLVTFLISLVLPVVAFFVGRRLSINSTDPRIIGLANGFLAFSLSFMPLLFFRQLCREKGVAECHFEWPSAAVRLLRRYLGWAMLLPVFAFVIAAIRTGGEPTARNPVPRLLLIAAAALATYIYSRVFQPDRGVLATMMLRSSEESWLNRLRYVTYWGIGCIPASLLVLACLGYEYTASQLAIRLFGSSIIVALAVVAYALVARLILVQRRKLTIAQAEQRRAKLIAARENAEGDSAGATTAKIPTEDDDDTSIEDLHSQTVQARKFASIIFVAASLAGLWLVWQPVVPALNFLEKWPLWTSTVEVAETFTDDTGEHIRKREVPDPVTIVELGLAILITLATFSTAKNVPGILEMSILQRLPLQRSVRYAITTLGRYLITLVGLLFAFKTIGLRWSQIQWMATALTFGLAFGLQEMFANFVAGVIILFERPIRVGDIVTVDDVTGSVSRIRMRATTITNWDRKDYIVPNKDFITGRVLNWTLSDKVNRIVVNVGVAYGSDVELARDLLTHVAASHPIVVDDPAPMTTFEAFDDSSLRFVLRCFISMADMPMRLQVVDDLHTTIDQEFRRAKIEIAFPQQDLHIQGLEALAGFQKKAS